MTFPAFLWKLAAAAFKGIKGWISAGGALIGFFWPPLQEALGLTTPPEMPPGAGLWIRIVVILSFPLLMLWEAHKLYAAELVRSEPDKKWDRFNAAVQRGLRLHTRGKKVSGAYSTSQDPGVREGYAAEMGTLAEEARALLKEHFPQSEAERFDAIEIPANADNPAQRLFNEQMGVLDGILAMAIKRLQSWQLK